MQKVYEDPKELNRTPKPLVVLAHSLGGHIMSNYIWDIQKKAVRSWNRVHLWVQYSALYLRTERHYSDHAAGRVKWLNYFDPDDVLGYPLKPLSAEYRKAVFQDIEINIGSVFQVGIRRPTATTGPTTI